MVCANPFANITGPVLRATHRGYGADDSCSFISLGSVPRSCFPQAGCVRTYTSRSCTSEILGVSSNSQFSSICQVVYENVVSVTAREALTTSYIRPNMT